MAEKDSCADGDGCSAGQMDQSCQRLRIGSRLATVAETRLATVSLASTICPVPTGWHSMSQGERVHARQRLDLLEQRREELVAFLRRRVLGGLDLELAGEQILRVEPEIDRRQMREAADQQAGANEQRHRERDLQNHQSTPQPATADILGGAARRAQLLGRIATRSPQGRNDSDQQSCCNRHQQGEDERLNRAHQ